MSPKQFAQIERQVLRALFAEPPTTGDAVDVEVFGEDGEQPVRYYVYADVLAELTKAARYRTQSAVAILVGHFALDGDGAFVEISGFEDLQYIWEEGDAGELLKRGVMDRLAALTRRDEQEDQRRHVVGMFWSEPGSDALLSEDAARAHLTYFNLPFQLALVCDGERGQVGLYARGPRQKFFNAALHLVSARDEVEEAAQSEERESVPVAAGAADEPSAPEYDTNTVDERPVEGAPDKMMPELEEPND